MRQALSFAIKYGKNDSDWLDSQSEVSGRSFTTCFFGSSSSSDLSPLASPVRLISSLSVAKRGGGAGYL